MPLSYQATTPDKDPAQRLAQMVADTKYEDLPAAAIERAKMAVLDTIAIMIGGTTATSGPVTTELFERWSGSGEGRVLFHGYKAPAPLAAFVNGVYGRALDLGDVSVEGGHISEFVVPALLSGVDVSGKKISGKDFLTAYNVAAEWGCRHHYAMRLHVHNVDGVPGEAGWTLTTPALAKLFGLTKEETLNAVGISFTCHGLPEQEKYYEGRESVRVQHGAFTGMSAAIQSSGAGELLSNCVIGAFGPLAGSPYGMCVIMLITVTLLSNFMSDSAAAAIVAPIAMSVALSLGQDPLPYIVAVAVGALAAVGTPLATAPIAMLQSVGYRFKDYVAVAGPCNIACVAVSAVMLKLVFFL